MTTEKHKATRSEATNTLLAVRIAYPFVHEKRINRPNGAPLKTPRYDATLLFPKTHSDPAQCQNYAWLAKHCIDAATKQWGSFPAGGHWPIQDGDAPPKPKAPVPGQAAAPAKEYPWRKGHWIVEVTSYTDPGPRVAILQNQQVVEIPARVINGKPYYKSGDFAIVSLHAYTFHNDKFGVNFGFEGILWTAEGEAIGSSGPRSAEQMFAGVAPMAAPQPTAQGYAHPAPMPPQPTAAIAAPPTVPAMPAPVAAPAGMPPLPPFPTPR